MRPALGRGRKWDTVVYRQRWGSSRLAGRRYQSPKNTSPAYSPLWPVSTVTWADPSKATTLRSEGEVLAAEAAELVTISKTQIVVNCPVIFTP